MIADEISALIAQGEKHEKPNKCAVLIAIQSFEGVDRDSLIHLIDKTKVPANRVVTLLAKHGIEIHRERITRHRNRNADVQNKCACPVEL